jgi:Icc protein
MLIAQITDLHLGFDRDDPNELNRARLDQVLEHLVRRTTRPDLLLVTGDLTEHGDAASYAAVADRLAALPFPARVIPGNHDLRAGFAEAFPATPTADGFVQYAIDAGPLRILMLDTLEEGRHGGGFCDTRARWLAAELERDPTRPTIIALHHPPFETGIDWMTTDRDEPWVARFDSALAAGRNTVAILCGHIHRAIATDRGGTRVVVCPSTAPALALTLSPMDPDRPDERPMVTEAPPGYALHLWRDGRLVTHLEWAVTYAPLARSDTGMQGLVRHLMVDERPDR